MTSGRIGIAGATFSFDRVVEMLNSWGVSGTLELEYVTADECRGLAEEKKQAFEEKM